ncbi:MULTISPECIES: helix-turn-helix domain-containing protein [Streptomyces]|uniref:helix-turn-helix domain-containing protein n=1 Tax=Streptomyces TaxID=1883 RepID=UPI00103BBF18|nr:MULTISPECIES: helix-turn-helix domain-containing protein [Streptomyces]MBT3073525.1 helix-turn-helix domain-containing protein [Streptomyces sp. COG21]MBT3083435.1 helix-turn-helix domain-containing protein [Streptomyces sp. COG20]MBT3088505.1 helix-turn-helix domain-containing protein [Streptomyces sp. CYG21]MBT3098320.1 helix-turn-helix domain-containing protein [Streptomyces sp. CBG30]MBT3101927.1 helix-turn-helix domain-containing protein [Streptomyces sp. COG19]
MTSERRRLEAAAPELSAELRRLRELNRLTLAALAKRTNYSKSSWERYLNGKVIPPESAVVAFAQTVGVRPDELLMLRNRAERAERAEREQTGEAPVRGPAAAGSGGRVTTGPDRAEGGEVAPEAGGSGEAEVVGHTAGTSLAASVAVPVPAPVSLPATVPAAAASDLASAPAPDPAAGGGADGGGPPSPWRAVAGPWRKGLVLAGIASVGAAVGLAVGIPLGTERGEKDRAGATAGALVSEERTAGGPGCIGTECREKDPQRLNCHIGVWTAAAAQRGDAYLELRYSPGCRSAWARLTEAGVGDTARVMTEQGVIQERSISYDGDTYSMMVEAPYPAAVKACADLRDGENFCTGVGGGKPLRESVTDESERG